MGIYNMSVRLLNPQRKKPKTSWMKGFAIPPRIDALEAAQNESRSNILNDFKKIKRR
jgi:hypothetical protein